MNTALGGLASGQLVLASINLGDFNELEGGVESGVINFLPSKTYYHEYTYHCVGCDAVFMSSDQSIRTCAANKAMFMQAIRD